MKFKLKALSQIEAAQAGDVSGLNQSVITLSSHKNRPPLSVLEHTWEAISLSMQGINETVLQVNKNTRNGKTEYIREFAETELQAHRYTAVLTALRFATQNLQRQCTTTLRDIYYRDVSAFHGSQSRSNSCLRLIEKSLGLSLEKDLRILPSPKGVIYGGPNITLRSNEGSLLKLSYDEQCSLVPSGISSEATFELIDNSLDGIIVMEKEAIFKSFSVYLSEQQRGFQLMLLTGKGNPDRASTRFLGAVEKSFPGVPITIVVDSDVYGLRILWAYLLSASSSSSNVAFAGTFLLEHVHGHLTIAPKEWKLMMNFLKELMAQTPKREDLQKNIVLMKRELTRGMLLGVKAEINVVCDSAQDDCLNGYLWKKVASNLCVTKRDPTICTTAYKIP